MSKTRDSGVVRTNAVYLDLGINTAGEKEILRLWIVQSEGAKFWLQVVIDLKNRGVSEIFIAFVEGLKGFPEAIEAVYPKTAVQLCLVHMVRHSLNYVRWKLRKVVAADLKAIYAASTTDEAQVRLQEFDEKWGANYPTIIKSWRSNWGRITLFFDYPSDIRRVIYTTNLIILLNSSMQSSN